MNFDYEFSELEPYIVGPLAIGDYFNFTISSEHAPDEGDKVLIEDKVYLVETVTDSDDNDYYLSKVYMCRNEE